MLLPPFARGLALGFCIAAPVGPIGVLCIRRTLAEGRAAGLAAAWASTFLLTLSNPMTILSFAAAFAGIGAGPRASYAGAATLVAGVCLGSAGWWLLLSGGVSAFRGRVDARAMAWVNRASGAVIGAFGVAALWSVIR